jgi:hypothetical protein
MLSPNLASVRLEIRRAKGRIRETRVQDPKNPSAELYITDADFIDEPETKAPWVIFEFNLQADSPDLSTDIRQGPASPPNSESNKSAPSPHNSDSEHSGARSQILLQFFMFLMFLKIT